MDWQTIKPVFWLGGGNLKKYATFLESWFAQVRAWISWPVDQLDEASAALFIVDLLAWERDIQRFSGEPEWLYRRRVKYAHQNAKDAGTARGLKRIWARMDLGYIEISERMTGRDWDIIELTVTDHALAAYPDLIDVILNNYALTCRRYELVTIVSNTLHIRLNHFEHTTDNLTARLEE